MALQLKMPVGQMLEVMSSDEITYWKAYFELEAEEQKQSEVRDRIQQNVKNGKGGRV